MPLLHAADVDRGVLPRADAEERADGVLTDLRLPGIGGVEATLSLRNRHSDAKIVVLATHDTDEDIYRAIQSGRSRIC